MFEYTCVLCGCEDAGDTTHHGDEVIGGFGSQFDVTKLVWIGDAPAIEDNSRLCDSCVSRFVDEGRLEAYSSNMDEVTGGTMSIAGYGAAFLMGANRFYAAVCTERGSFPVASQEWDQDRIVSMRGYLELDPSETSSVLGGKSALGRKAYGLGRAHAAAAVLLDMAGGTSPDFKDDARDFAVGFKAFEEKAAICHAETVALFNGLESVRSFVYE